MEYVLPLESITNIFENVNKPIEPLLPDNSAQMFVGERLKPEAEKVCSKKIYITPKTNFHIITFNVHGWVSRCKHKNGKYRDFNRFINYFKKVDADLLLLQEVKPVYSTNKTISGDELKKVKYDYDLFYKKMGKLGYKYIYIVDGNPGESYIKEYFVAHNAICSKHPFIEKMAYQIPGNRSFQMVRLKVNKQLITIYNTHLSASTRDRNVQLNRNKKGPNNMIKYQLDLLLMMIAKLNEGREEPILVGGDFNFPYTTIKRFKGEYKRFEYPNTFTNFLEYFTDTLDDDQEHRVTNFNANTYTDIIFGNTIFFKKAKDVKAGVDTILISDHFPVFVDFRI